MELAFFNDPYELTDGRYPARFEKVERYHNPQLKAPDGSPMQPGLRWHFTLSDGPDAGKPASVITAEVPTGKNSCGRMMAAIIDDSPVEGLRYNFNLYIGGYYMVTIQESRVSHQFPPRYLGRTIPKSAETPPPEVPDNPRPKPGKHGPKDDPVPF